MYIGINSSQFINTYNKKSLIELINSSFNEEQINIVNACITWCVKERKLPQEEIKISLDDKLNVTGLKEGSITKSILDEIEKGIKYMAYIYTKGFNEEYEKNNYLHLRDSLQSLNCIQKQDKDLIEKLLEHNLPLHNNLITFYKENILNNYIKYREIQNIKAIASKLKVGDEELNKFKNCKLHLVDIALEKAVDNEIKLEEKEEIFEIALNLFRAYNKLSNDGKIHKENFINLVKSSKVVRYYVNNEKGERLATKKEVKRMLFGVYAKSIYALTQDKTKLMNVFGWVLTGDDNYYFYTGKDKKETEIEKVNELKLEIEQLISYLDSKEFIETDIKELQKSFKLISTDYLDNAEDELKDGKLIDKLKYIDKHAKPGNYYTEIAMNIASKAIKYSRLDLSEKQIQIINNVYNKLKGTKPVMDITNRFDSNLKEMMESIIKCSSTERDKFILSVISTIKETERCSVKQYNLIQDFYNDKISEKDILFGNKKLDNANKIKDMFGVDTPLTIDEYTNDSGLGGDISLAQLSNILGQGIQ